jgi:predicted permease
MAFFAEWLRRLRYLLNRRRLEADLREQVEAHRAEMADPARFGTLLRLREEARDAWGWRWLDSAAQDLRFALRAMRKVPGVTLVVLLTLALGIGANTAIFSVIDAVFLRPLAVTDPGRLVLFSTQSSLGTMSGGTPDGTWRAFSSESYEFLRGAHLPLQGVAAFSGTGNDTVVLHRSGASQPQAAGAASTSLRATAHLVSGTYFAVMGASAAVGRTLTAADDRPNAPPVAVASDRFWRRRLDASPQAVGTTVTLNRLTVTIVGVMSASFFGEIVRTPPDLWIPLVWQPDIQLREPLRDHEDEYWLHLMGRLAPGETQAVAQAAATAALRRFLSAQAGSQLDARARDRISRTRIAMASGARGVSFERQADAAPLTLLMVAVALVLLVACANVATLLLCRATARRTEVAVRRALGASRGRLVRQWLTESAVLGALGAAGGVLVAHWVAPTLEARFPTGPVHVTLNRSVLLFTTGIALVSSLAVGVAPALRAGRVDPLAALRSAGRGTRARRRTFGATEPFVIVELAVSLVLVLAATLFMRTVFNLEGEPLGFDQTNVLAVKINPRLAGYTPADAPALYRRLDDRMAALPGVERATFARYSPFGGYTSSFSAKIEGYTPAPDERVQLETVEVGPDYPQALGMPLVAGRAIDRRDVTGATPVAMVNETLVQRYFPKSSPLGHHLTLDNQTFEIVGVVKDALFHNARDPMVPFVFTPMLQEHTRMALDCEFDLRASGDLEALAAAARQAVADTNSGLSVMRTETLRAQVLATFGPERLAAGFVGTFAGLALVLAAVGLYGVVSYSVAGRTQEIGLRQALGASGGDIVWLVLRETLVWLGIGLGLGAIAAEAGGRLVASQLFGVTPADVPSLVMAAATLGIVTVAASLVPAVRALRVQPVAALNAE